MDDFLYKAIHKARMSNSPSYYSGRGATTSDLGYEHLSTIAQAIKENKGDKAQKNFVHMVAQIPVLSATDFLVTLHKLQDNNWEWNQKLLPTTNGVHIDSEGSAFGTVMSMMGGPRGDATVQIRAQFLREHGVPDPRPDANDPYGDHRMALMAHDRETFMRQYGIPSDSSPRPSRRRRP